MASALPGLPFSLLVGHASGWEGDKLAPALRLTSLKSFDDSLHVVSMFFRNSFSDGSNFFHDPIADHKLFLHELLWRADDRRQKTDASARVLNFTAESSVCNVRAIPH